MFVFYEISVIQSTPFLYDICCLLFS